METKKKNISSWVRLMVHRWENEVLPTNNENRIHDFLREYASLFLTPDPWDGVIVSKMKLGSSFETDFVVIKDRYSAGLSYNFVKIEIPEVKLFNAPSKPSGRLNTAIAQINSWKQWLSVHSQEAIELFPSRDARRGYPPNFKFTIVIGRRAYLENDSGAQKDRAWLSYNNQIEIRSFDSLTENASNENGGG